MSDMWTSINLDFDENLDEARQVKPIAEWPEQDSLSFFDREAAQEYLDDEGTLREYVAEVFREVMDAKVQYLEFDDNRHNLYAAGGSSYETDDGKTLAAELTEVTYGTATIKETWTGDDPKVAEFVYVNGIQDEEAGEFTAQLSRRIPSLVGQLLAADEDLDRISGFMAPEVIEELRESHRGAAKALAEALKHIAPND